MLAGAVCASNGSFLPRVPNSIWVASKGIYRLIHCPPGHQLVNSTDGTSKGVFSQALQSCKPCLPGQYIIDENYVCEDCPLGTPIQNSDFKASNFKFTHNT